MVFLILLAVIGIPGNLIAAAYFRQTKGKKSTDMFIFVLSIVDLLICASIFVYIVQLSLNVSVYLNRHLCKLTFFVYHWIILLSVSIVCAIAVDRFIKMRLPKERHFKCTTARNISLVLVLASCLISLRDFWTYDSFAVNITISDITVEGRMCMNVRSENLKSVVTAFYVIDISTMSIILVILVSSYAGIVWKLYKHRKVRKSYFQENPNTDPESPSHDSRTIIAERDVTLMMLFVSVALIVCFVPYFIVNLIKFQGKDIEFELTAGYRFALGLVLTNSACNPVIYSIFNPPYRRYLCDKFTRCIRRNTHEEQLSTEMHHK